MEAAASGPVTAEAKYLREVRQTIQLALQVTLARQGYEVCCDPLSGEVIVPACPATGHAARPCLTGGLRPHAGRRHTLVTPPPRKRGGFSLHRAGVAQDQPGPENVARRDNVGVGGM
ncbi:hypothetical protein, partial [Nonomuraea africana]|uniref:hypothetical protein n=1 Tax=Nonomuraea africana TaxID=46171 RepID=UPI0033CB3F2A